MLEAGLPGTRAAFQSHMLLEVTPKALLAFQPGLVRSLALISCCPLYLSGHFKYLSPGKVIQQKQLTSHHLVYPL